LNTKRDKIEHAKHNKSACEFLGTVDRFPDWMVTTAFYSALHYMDSKLFPLKYKTKSGNSISFSSLDTYYTFRKKEKPDLPAKHEVRKCLTANNLDSDIASRFERLSDASSTARYSDYKAYTFTEAQKFYNDLCLIEEVCFSKQMMIKDRTDTSCNR